MSPRATADHAGADRRAARGFTLVEVLVSLAIVALTVGLLAVLAVPVLEAFEADPAAADAAQRGRGVAQVLFDDLREAGSGFLADPEIAPGVALPAVWPDALTLGTWTPGARAHTLSAWHAPRGAAHLALAVDVPPGASVLPLTRPAFCSAVSPSCGLGATDEVLIHGPHGRIAVSEVRQVLPPLDLELTVPLVEAWPAGTRVSVIDAHTYELRPDAATGLSQITRRVGAGPATALVDYVTRFDVEWWVDAGAPRVVVAPPNIEEDTSAGPAPPPPGRPDAPPWAAGENCAFARDALGVARWRGSVGGAMPGVAPLTQFGDGPWCPSATAAVRWDADVARVSAVRVVMAIAAASTTLRPPIGLGLRRPRARLVPDLVLDTTVRIGRRNGGG
ncbi:MAG: prepilin-type N-terminal cleavage/methylation domain-containing protein [Vicinamibacterales bacterium]